MTVLGRPRSRIIVLYYFRNANRSSQPTGVKRFKKAVIEFHEKAGVKLGVKLGKSDLEKFQSIISHQLVVWASASTPKLLFKGDPSKKVIHLLYDVKEQHYDVITGKL